MGHVRASTIGGTPTARRALVVVLALLLGWLIAPSAAAQTADDLEVRLTKVTVSAPLPAGLVTVSGTVTNRSDQPIYAARADLWRSTTTLRSPEIVTDALTTQTSPLGKSIAELEGVTVALERGSSAALTEEDAALKPGESAPFTVKATLADLDLARADASYWVGVNASARDQAKSSVVSQGRARTLITIPGQTSPVVVTVVELSARPRMVSPGVFTDDGLADDIAARLDVFADAADDPGFTYAVDPALVAELDAMADGYQVITKSGTTAGTGSGVARELLERIKKLPAAQGYQTRFAHANPAIGDSGVRGARASAETGLGLPELPDAVADGAVQPSQVASNGVLGDHPVTIPAILQAQARIAPQIRLIRTPDDLVLDRLATPPWLARTQLGAVPPASLPQPAPPEPDEKLAASLNELAQAMTTYGAVAPDSGASALVDAQYARGASRWWESERDGREAFLTEVDDRLGAGAFGLGITLDITPRLTMSSAEAQFPVTLTNHLSDVTEVRLVITTDQPQRISFDPVDPIKLRSDASQTVNLHARASANGVVNAHIHLETLDGHRLTPEKSIIVEATNLGLIGWVIVVVSGVVLVATTALRIIQIRRKQGKNAA